MSTDPALLTAATQVSVNPKDQLTFNGPFNQMKVLDLTVTNESKFRLAYKFRCTRPDGLKFRPGYGLIRPGRERLIKIRCLPITGATPSKDRCTMVIVALSDEQRPDKGSKFWKSENPPKEMHRVSWEIKYVGAGAPSPAKEEEKEKEKEETEADEEEGGDSE